MVDRSLVWRRRVYNMSRIGLEVDGEDLGFDEGV